MRPVSMTLGLFLVDVPSPIAADAVPSVKAITASSAEDLSTTGEDHGHATRLEEVLMRNSVNRLLSYTRKPYMIP